MDIGKLVVGVLIVFLLGWSANSVYNQFRGGYDSIDGFTVAAVTAEKISPQNHLSENDINVYQDKVVIEKPGMMWSRFVDSNSMDPTIDSGANGLEIKPLSTTDINVGDIISYKLGNDIIVHRVIEIGIDSRGWYAVAKGDNNAEKDPFKIRFNDVHGIVVGVIY